MRYPLDAPTMFKAANRTHYERTVLLMLNGQLRCAWFPAYSSSLRLRRS